MAPSDGLHCRQPRTSRSSDRSTTRGTRRTCRAIGRGPPPEPGRGPAAARPGRSSGVPGTTTGAPRRMARLAGVDLPRDKRMEVALTYIYGIGRTRSMEILNATGIGHDLRTKDLTDEDLARAARRTSRATSGSRATCAARCRPTSAGRSRSAATRGSGTAGACRSAASAPRPTRAAARVRRRPSPARRRQVRSNAAPQPYGGRTEEGPPQGEEERRRTATRTSRAPSTTRSCPSPTRPVR